MATWAHRTTFQVLYSTSEASLVEPAANYVFEPDLSAVVDWSTIYWILTGDIFTLMDQSARDAADAAIEAQLLLDERNTAIIAPYEVYVDDIAGIQLRALFEVFNKRDNYLVTRIAQLQIALTDLQSSSGNAATRLDGLPVNYLPTNTRTRFDAIRDYKDDIDSGGAD